jgi:hypothetical protein
MGVKLWGEKYIMRGTFEIEYTSAVSFCTEKVGASSLRVAVMYAEKEAKAFGAQFTVRPKSFPKYTKIKKVDTND